MDRRLGWNPGRARDVAGLACSFVLLSAGIALADYDMSGKWRVLVTQSSGTQVVDSSIWDVVQTGSDLDVTIHSYAYVGTIDPGTGNFELVLGQPYPECGTNSLTGNVSADGRTLTGTYYLYFYAGGCHGTLGCHFYCTGGPLGLEGSRCGNGELDDGEDCDDGDVLDGDCCSSACELDSPGTACTSDSDACTDDVCDGAGTCLHPSSAAGTSCASDSNVCTDDVCDGAGACVHPLNAAPCEDPGGCGSGNCSAGSCQITSPQPAGTPCNGAGAVCTVDLCDGAGHCEPEPIAAGSDCDSDEFDCTSAACDGAGQCIVDDVTACAPCGYCAGAEGCIRDEVGDSACDSDIDKLSIAIRLGEPDRRRLTIKLKDDVELADFGDPSAATPYTVCLYENDGVGGDRVLGQAVVPPAGICDGVACWSQRRSGFSYRDEAGASDGIESLKLGESSGIAIKGSGAGLPLPESFTSQQRSVYPKIVAGEGSTSKCWTHDVSPRRLGSDVFVGRY